MTIETMAQISGLVGRDVLIDSIRKELKKGKHILLCGEIGIGKSIVMTEALSHLPGNKTIIDIQDHQTKGQFVELAKQLLYLGFVKPVDLDLPSSYEDTAISEIPWDKVKRRVNRNSIRDLASAIIPALKRGGNDLIIAVDDISFLTPTQQAFWLTVLEHTQVIGCASEKKKGVQKLWWKMKHFDVPRLKACDMTEIVENYVDAKGLLIESRKLFISHVVKVSAGIPAAAFDMLHDSSKERVVSKRHVREMSHSAGIEYVSFTPYIIVGGASIVGMRYVAIGLGDTSLYIMAGMSAAIFLGLRFALFKGNGAT
jgi:hypothetical protein